MLQALAQADRYKVAKEAEVQRRVTERFGDLLREGGKLEAEALHSTMAHSMDHILVEIRALARMAGTERGLRQAPLADLDSIKARVATVVDATVVWQLKPNQHFRDAQKHAIAAATALAKKDVDAAYASKQAQAWSMAFYRAERDALDRVNRAVDEIRKTQTPKMPFPKAFQRIPILQPGRNHKYLTLGLLHSCI